LEGDSVTSNRRACLQKVLFAEDEALVRLMMADVLREEGFQVIEVSDAAEAISILKAMPVDVVITDLRMSAVAHRSATACACLREPSLLLATLFPSTFLRPGSRRDPRSRISPI
jgi:CheY-like chemotaxis protein